MPPPPPKKKQPGENPPPKKSDGAGESGSGGTGNGSSSGASGASHAGAAPVASGKSQARTTAIVVLATGGVITVVGTTMILLGVGAKPSGKQGGSNTGLVVAGGATTVVGLTVATVGLVLLLKSNNGQLPPLKSLTADHPAVRMPAWESTAVGVGPVPDPRATGFVLPWQGTF